ncbi:inactive rhomboid protein 1-like [Littorina saxatilis]
MSSAGGLAPTGVLSTMEIRRDIQTFLGAETLHRYVIPNPWIGPPATIMLAAGASFAPCLRRDHYVRKQGAARRFRKIDDVRFGCCQMRGPLNAAGTTTRAECARYTNNAGVWGPPYCSLRPPGNNSVEHVIRPCCTDHRGTCQMLSHQHCAFLKGHFHIDKEHCVQVFCLRDVCTMGRNLFRIDSNPDMPWLARKGTIWQWWRPLLSQFYTFGFMHCLPLLVIEWLLMRPFEESAGWFRVMIIYTICGLAGQLVGGLADPTIPQEGSTSGVAGIIGEAAVELSQAWKLLDKPDTEAIKLGCFMLLLLLMGMLPYVSFLGCLAGCGCGVICAVVFMPYITFDRWDICRKITLVIVGVTTLALIFSLLLYFYITLQPATCQACRKLECLSFTDNMCNVWDLLG